MNRTVSLVLLVAAACASPAKYTISVSSTSRLAEKPATCEFRVVNLPPSGADYEEIATLTPDYYSAYKPDDFKRAVAAPVCRVGGEVVVTEVNGQGAYVRGTVLRQRPSPTADQK